MHSHSLPFWFVISGLSAHRAGGNRSSWPLHRYHQIFGVGGRPFSASQCMLVGSFFAVGDRVHEFGAFKVSRWRSGLWIRGACTLISPCSPACVCISRRGLRWFCQREVPTLLALFAEQSWRWHRRRKVDVGISALALTVTNFGGCSKGV